MVEIVQTADHNYLQVKAGSSFLEKLRSVLSAKVKGYYFMPAYRNGTWDGRVYFIFPGGRFYRGLVFEVLKEARHWGESVKINKNIFVNPLQLHEVNLKTKLWPEQKEALDRAFRFKFGLVKMPTGSGKTLVELALIDQLWQRINGKIAIIVPRLSLVEQFYERFAQFASTELFQNAGRVYGGRKEFEKKVLIFTWQTLVNLSKQRHKIFNNISALIFDEVHFAKAHEIKKMLLKFRAADYRWGFTATLPKDRADLLSVKSVFGEVVYEVALADAISNKKLAPLTVKPVVLEYSYPRGLTFQEYEQWIVEEDFRYEALKQILQEEQGKNVLILVRHIKVADTIGEQFGIPVFKGATVLEERKQILQYLEQNRGAVVVATLGVFGVGIDVKNVDVLILFQPRKSEIELLQAIGRGLRRLPGKHLIVYDFADKLPYFSGFFKNRLEVYKNEKVEIADVIIKTKEDLK